jgi:predicted enzyme related to lactoylglutathione lyase
MPPTHANGEVRYIEIPATDVARSAAFHAGVCGWQTAAARRGEHCLRRHDRRGERRLGDRPAADPVIADEGEIVQPSGVDAPEVTARFRDPGGNIIGLYQEPG